MIENVAALPGPSEFRAGDVVQLKSGGASMTVMKAPRGKLVFCQWFQGEGELYEEHFEPVCLRKVPETASQALPPSED